MIQLSDLSIIIPYRHDSVDRAENLSAGLRYFSINAKDVEVIVIESGLEPRARRFADEYGGLYEFIRDDGPFHRTRLLNLAIETMTRRRFVANCDADILIFPSALEAAAMRLRRGDAIVFPFNGVFLDVRRSTRRALIDTLDFSCLPDPIRLARGRRLGRNIACANRNSVGGAVFFDRETLLACGGYNERFLSWGAEDNEIAQRFDRLGHPIRRIYGYPILHLAHRRGRDSSTRNPYFRANQREYHRLRSLDQAELRTAIAAGELRWPGEVEPGRADRTRISKESLVDRARRWIGTTSSPVRQPVNKTPQSRLRLCYVVHRYAPWPGGSETYVQSLAQESARRDHDSWVFTSHHDGDRDGVYVTNDEALLGEPFDLVVVHGSFRGSPQQVLSVAHRLPSPVLYLLVSHTDRALNRRGLRHASYLGWSTPDDRARLGRRKLMAKAVYVRHGIDADQAVGHPGFRARHGIPADKRMFVSAGGYWPNKRMRELAALFETTRTDAILVTTGYDDRYRLMPDRSDRVLPLMIDDGREVLSAIAEADCYLMHSKDEGFGLTLLEAMLNRTPWIAHAAGGARLLNAFGRVYERDEDLVRLIESFERDESQIEQAHRHVLHNHLVGQAVDDIEAVARQSATTGGLAGQHVGDGSTWS